MTHFSEIDYTPFCRYLENLIGVNISVDNTGSRPEIICTNLTPYVGIMAHCLKSVGVGIFNFDFRKDAEPGTNTLWATVNLHYQTKSGCGNGVTLCEVWYYEEEGWIFSKPA